ncbi:hypothetical protein D3C72_1966530 [compost metagenome]
MHESHLPNDWVQTHSLLPRLAGALPELPETPPLPSDQPLVRLQLYHGPAQLRSETVDERLLGRRRAEQVSRLRNTEPPRYPHPLLYVGNVEPSDHPVLSRTLPAAESS